MANHPYSPEDLQLPGYVPLFSSPFEILGVYGSASTVVVLLIWIISGSCSEISTTDRFLMCWWTFTGLTHIILEGYYLFSPNFYKLESPFYLAEVWKEYSKGDSRYVARDSGVVTLAGITVIIAGPLSLLAVYAIGVRKPYRYILQFAVSVMHLYGNILYYVTALLDGDNFAASQQYYWAYYVFANSFWLVIPTLIAIRCWKKVIQPFSSEKTKNA